MDYSLSKYGYLKSDFLACLNPYSNGLLSEEKFYSFYAYCARLNPYSNGLLSENFLQTKYNWREVS